MWAGNKMELVSELFHLSLKTFPKRENFLLGFSSHIITFTPSGSLVFSCTMGCVCWKRSIDGAGCSGRTVQQPRLSSVMGHNWAKKSHNPRHPAETWKTEVGTGI